MTHLGNHHDNSQPTSSVEMEHYPATALVPTHADIAERARLLWLMKGCPTGSDEENWLEAERELHAAALSRRLIEINNERGGSVQA